MILLHLTDFHFKPEKQDVFKQNKIVQNILNHIKINKINVDFICFTGDLVYSGIKLAEFHSAINELANAFLNALNLPKDRFFICPGNHDVDRTKVSPAVISKIDTFTNNKDVDTFVIKSDIDFKSSLEPLKNYTDFVESYFTKNHNDKTYFGYTTHLRKFGEKKIGILCLNTAWRAIGNNDEGNLLFPISWINAGLLAIKDCDIKLVLHHHPISQFKLFNQYELEDVIHNNFNISLSGHLHKNNTSVCYTDKDGILKLASAATLADNDGSTIGFTTLDLDMETFGVEAICYKYDQQSEFFYHGTPTKLQIPITIEKAKQNKFRQRLRTLYDFEVENAEDLFLNGRG